MDLFFIGLSKQADDRIKGVTNDLETYITLRRDSGGSKFCFTLIEYTARIDLPDEVILHPVIKAMEEAANDVASWSNVISHSVVEHWGTADITADRTFSLTTWSSLALTRII